VSYFDGDLWAGTFWDGEYWRGGDIIVVPLFILNTAVVETQGIAVVETPGITVVEGGI
jgi:hypothetical protein